MNIATSFSQRIAALAALAILLTACVSTQAHDRRRSGRTVIVVPVPNYGYGERRSVPMYPAPPAASYGSYGDSSYGEEAGLRARLADLDNERRQLQDRLNAVQARRRADEAYQRSLAQQGSYYRHY